MIITAGEVPSESQNANLEKREVDAALKELATEFASAVESLGETATRLTPQSIKAPVGAYVADATTAVTKASCLLLAVIPGWK